MKTNILTLTLVSIATLATAGARDIRLADCPPAVRSTIEANARGGVIDEVDLIAIEGNEIYIGEVELPRDLDLKIYVSGSGTLLKTREDISLRSMPGFIREAVSKHGGKIDDVEKEVQNGKVTWHVEIDRKGIPDLKVVLNAEGSVISETEDLD
ncbi:hypothetical protein OKA04_10200 [Luteolibacter flavescens]|uniref:PepSY domain-containing protein n=1 Tax=Luteolibacter flavescens TaxID=1859460 RepID=A0ABT3FNF5_9BACT|nr:hypothetical protein [Luteolibacter flavescens]MCW1885099.1 hypothetical protein [Luteolibacter flavescens]